MSNLMSFCLPAKFSRKSVSSAGALSEGSGAEQDDRLDREQLTELFHDLLREDTGSYLKAS